MEKEDLSQRVFENLVQKGTLKQQVYANTLEAFRMLKREVARVAADYKQSAAGRSGKIPVEYTDRGEFEGELQFAGDVLLFMMHTNVFEIPRDHAVMRTPYLREDKERSYCGIINIFNFLADSFRYNRMNDSGYLIGRVFVNKDRHYFIEGKREVGMLYPNFPTAVFNAGAIRELVLSAMQYSVDFDLLTPPYDAVKEVTVNEIRTALDNMQLKTAKRMGYRFQADNGNGDS
ncbi:MAG TPA: hypothetical protein P5550_05770 [Bacteroidales bacterium]|nr:hypothetical protein [Bacteroidales bacterium]